VAADRQPATRPLGRQAHVFLSAKDDLVRLFAGDRIQGRNP
jgi:hypothetical protein